MKPQLMYTEGFGQILQNCSPQIQALLLATKESIGKAYPGLVEVPWVKQKTIGYGIGAKKMSEHFCWIGIYSHHIILGFNYGTALHDPGKLLEGTGKSFRHYKIKSLQDLKNPFLMALLHEAVMDIQSRNKTD